MSVRRVVVTGLGAVSPLGLSVEETWESVLAGRSGVGPITLFDASTFPTRIAAEVKGFSVAPYVRKRETARVLSRAASFGLAAAKMAWEDAGLEGKVAPERVGVTLGSCLTAPGPTESNAWCRRHDDGVPPQEAFEDPFGFVRRSSHAGTALISAELGARGPAMSVYVACASGTQALGMGTKLVQRGEAEVVLAGGYDSMISEWDILLFSVINALSRRNDDPTRASRPFERHRDGFVMGEGSGILVLEEREHALARGAESYAEVLGYGGSLDAYRITDSPPDGAGAARAMARALAQAGLRPEEVGHINAHGTSTRDNDYSETQAVKGVFGEAAYQVAISSTKSMTGHLISAAGGLEACLSVLALRDGRLPPTINLDEPDPECDLNYVPHTARRRALKVVMSNSFGFGGSNGSVLFGAPHGMPARAPREVAS
jgi:3-oxoacyl-[acyl-carrier-protein] synthase II